MAASLFDSPMFTKAFPVGEAGRLFAESAIMRSILLVGGTLAKVQGEAGIIPVDSAFFIHRSAMEVQIDPAGLAIEIAEHGHPARALATAFHKAMEAPEHAQYIHHDVHPKDIERTALILRLRQFLTLCEGQLTKCAPDCEALAQLPTLRETALTVSFETENTPLRAALAEALRLGNDPTQWVDAKPLLAIADWAAFAAKTAIDTSKSDDKRLSVLMALAANMNTAMRANPAQMADSCLAQICLSACSAMEIINAPAR